MHLFKALKRKYSVVQSFQHIQLWSSLKLRYIAELYSARDLKGWTDSTMPDGWVAALHIVHHIETYNARCWIISIFFCDTSRLSGKDSFTDLLNIFYTGFVSHLKWKTITMGRVAIGRKKKKKTASYLSQPKNLAFHWFAWPIQTEEYVFIGCPWPLGCQQNGIHFTTVNKSFFSCCPTTLWQTYLKLRNRFVVTHQNWISPRCNMKNYAFSKHNNLPPHLNTLRTC